MIRKLIIHTCLTLLVLTSGFLGVSSVSAANKKADATDSFQLEQLDLQFEATDMDEQYIVGHGKVLDDNIYVYELTSGKTFYMTISDLPVNTDISRVLIDGNKLVWSAFNAYTGQVLIQSYTLGAKSYETILNQSGITLQSMTSKGMLYTNWLGYSLEQEIWFYQFDNKQKSKIGAGEHVDINGSTIVFNTRSFGDDRNNGQISYSSTSKPGKTTALPIKGQNVKTDGNQLVYYYQPDVSVDSKMVKLYDLKTKKEITLASDPQGGVDTQNIVIGHDFAVWDQSTVDSTHFYHIPSNKTYSIDGDYTPIAINSELVLLSRGTDQFYLVRHGDPSQEEPDPGDDDDELQPPVITSPKNGQTVTTPTVEVVFEEKEGEEYLIFVNGEDQENPVTLKEGKNTIQVVALRDGYGADSKIISLTYKPKKVNLIDKKSIKTDVVLNDEAYHVTVSGKVLSKKVSQVIVSFGDEALPIKVKNGKFSLSTDIESSELIEELVIRAVDSKGASQELKVNVEKDMIDDDSVAAVINNSGDVIEISGEFTGAAQMVYLIVGQSVFEVNEVDEDGFLQQFSLDEQVESGEEVILVAVDRSGHYEFISIEASDE